MPRRSAVRWLVGQGGCHSYPHAEQPMKAGQVARAWTVRVTDEVPQGIPVLHGPGPHRGVPLRHLRAGEVVTGEDGHRNTDRGRGGVGQSDLARGPAVQLLVLDPLPHGAVTQHAERADPRVIADANHGAALGGEAFEHEQRTAASTSSAIIPSPPPSTLMVPAAGLDEACPDPRRVIGQQHLTRRISTGFGPGVLVPSKSGTVPGGIGNDVGVATFPTAGGMRSPSSPGRWHSGHPLALATTSSALRPGRALDHLRANGAPSPSEARGRRGRHRRPPGQVKRRLSRGCRLCYRLFNSPGSSTPTRSVSAPEKPAFRVATERGAPSMNSPCEGTRWTGTSQRE